MIHPPTIVVNSLLPHQSCITDEDPRLGEICTLITFCRALKRACAEVRVELATEQRKQQHRERLEAFLTRRADAAKRCREAIGLSDPKEHTSIPLELPTKTRPDWFTRPAERPITFDIFDKHVTGRYGKVYQTTNAPKGQGLHGRNNWCPVCKEYVAMSHDGPKGIACEKYVEQRTRREAAHLTWLQTRLPHPVSTQPMVFLKNGARNYVEDQMIARVDQLGQNARQRALNLAWNLLPEYEEVRDQEAPQTAKGQRKSKRHYVRHGAVEEIT